MERLAKNFPIIFVIFVCFSQVQVHATPFQSDTNNKNDKGDDPVYYYEDGIQEFDHTRQSQSQGGGASGGFATFLNGFITGLSAALQGGITGASQLVNGFGNAANNTFNGLLTGYNSTAQGLFQGASTFVGTNNSQQ